LGLNARDSRSRPEGVREFKSHPLHHVYEYSANYHNRFIRNTVQHLIMPLFKVENGRVKQLELTAFRSESELQDLVERNIEEIFGLRFVETEYDIPPFRMDTIAFDEENRSFVIIEYKESEHFSVVDQGVAYLNSLLAHKGEFRLLLERRFDKKMENID
jgi:hypothetical protein